jgi:carbamoyltransferase
VHQILGLNLGHNSSLVLIESNLQIVRLEEEKLSQKKGCYGFPKLGFEYVQKFLQNSNKIDVVIGHNNLREVFQSHRLLIKFCGIQKITEYFWLVLDLYAIIARNSKVYDMSIKRHFGNYFKRKIKQPCNIRYIDHHTSHAYSAVYDSGYSRCLVITEDGKGDDYSGKVFAYENNSLVEITRKSYVESYGVIYSAATKALGFKALRHEGKITGLAAYGNPESLCKLIHNEFNSLVNDKFEKLKNYHPSGLTFRARFQTRLVRPSDQIYSNLMHYWVNWFKDKLVSGVSREDIAASVQRFLEDRVLADLSLLRVDFDKLALAGGVFANVKLNQKIWETDRFTNIFVQPAMDDAGTALGAAALFSQQLNRGGKLKDIVYLGTIQKDLNLAMIGENFTEINLGSNKYELIADFIEAGKIVGVFNSRTEWGPRALGNRSILASAFLPEISNELNNRLKRNDFMPFAPIVRDSDAGLIFEKFSKGLDAAKFMTVTLSVKKIFEKQIRSVIHIDGTARPQVLYRKDNESIYKILDEIAIRKGIGIVLNTSFNIHEFPILNDIGTALNNLKLGSIDLLYINDKILISNS